LLLGFKPREFTTKNTEKCGLTTIYLFHIQVQNFSVVYTVFIESIQYAITTIVSYLTIN